MILFKGDHTMYWHWQYIDVDLSALDPGEEILQRAPGKYSAGLLRKRNGSLLMTSARLLFLAPPHGVARWRNCSVSLPLREILSVESSQIGRKWLAAFNGELSIQARDETRYRVSIDDAHEWRGAITRQCKLAGNRVAS